ncbi:MAG TPA: ferritin family protein [bacterium]
MSVFDAREILLFAIRIEENGEAFYRNMSAKLPEPRIQDLFRHLAGQELVHRDIYRSMLSKLQAYTPPETYTDEYGAYLRAYVDNKIFNAGRLDEYAAAITTAKAAIDFAIDRELESILYYQEILMVVPEEQKNEINKIIGEEKNHFMKLSELRKTIA